MPKGMKTGKNIERGCPCQHLGSIYMCPYQHLGFIYTSNLQRYSQSCRPHSSLDLPSTIPAEQKNVHWPQMGEQSRGGGGVSFTLEVEFEFTTWAWVQATAKTAFGSGLVVRSPGSVKALNQSTHNSLSHCWNVHSAVAGHGRMNDFWQWLATAKWTFQQWPRELWVDWFNALTEPGDRTTRPPQNAVSAVAWTQAQVVNSNSTSAVQDPRGGGAFLLVAFWEWLFTKEPVALWIAL